MQSSPEKGIQTYKAMTNIKKTNDTPLYVQGPHEHVVAHVQICMSTPASCDRMLGNYGSSRLRSLAKKVPV